MSPKPSAQLGPCDTYEQLERRIDKLTVLVEFFERTGWLEEAAQTRIHLVRLRSKLTLLRTGVASMPPTSASLH